jgi:hypothetical protein
MTPSKRAALVADQREKIKKFGHVVVCVGSGEHAPTFAYTAGLAEAGLGELMIIGVRPESAVPILNAAATAERKLERSFTLGERIELGGRMPAIMLMPSPMAAELLQPVCAVVHAPDNQCELWIVAAPDDEGRSPLDPACKEPWCQLAPWVMA